MLNATIRFSTASVYSDEEKHDSHLMSNSTLKFTHGLIIGKFMLLHKGHCFLIETALLLCETLHICLCSRKEDVIDGVRRYEWIKETYEKYIVSGKLVVHHTTKEIQDAHVKNTNAPLIWAQEISQMIPVSFDVIFASENYGWNFAQFLGAQFIPIDTHRDIVSVSSTEIQENVHAYWHYISQAVRSDMVMVLGLKGSKEKVQRFTKNIGATMYVAYCMRENSKKIPSADISIISAAQLTIMRRMSKPVICILLPDTNTEQCYEFHQCERVFTIRSEYDLQNAEKDAKVLLKQYCFSSRCVKR